VAEKPGDHYTGKHGYIADEEPERSSEQAAEHGLEPTSLAAREDAQAGGSTLRRKPEACVTFS
jgi:hypothetical protein